MKRVFFVGLLFICCQGLFSGMAHALFFDGMEAYRQNDYQTALREFRSVEEDARAIYMVGVMFEKGEGMAADPAEAATWFRKAADKGYSAAQYRLGRLYERGLGVDQNRDEALALYRKAARNGNLDARQALKRMGVK